MGWGRVGWPHGAVGPCPVLVGDGSTSWARIALSPDGGTLWVSQVGLQIEEWTYPGLTLVGTEIANNPSFPIMSNFLASDDVGDIYWARFGYPTGYTIWRHTPGGSSVALYVDPVGMPGDTLVACWSPYDGLIYVLDNGVLWSLDPSSGARVDVYTGGGLGSGAGSTQPVPTLDGGIWFMDAATTPDTLTRFDIPSGTAASIAHGLSGAVSVVPRPTNDVLDGEHADQLITWDGSALSASTLACVFEGPFAVAYTPDLSTVAWATSRFGLARPSEIWALP